MKSTLKKNIGPLLRLAHDRLVPRCAFSAAACISMVYGFFLPVIRPEPYPRVYVSGICSRAPEGRLRGR
jgi:hypothetical protein